MTSAHDLSFGLEITRSGFDSLKYKSRIEEITRELELVKVGDHENSSLRAPWHACLLGYSLDSKPCQQRFCASSIERKSL